MSSSRSQEDTYEAQNDQRLDELHSKIRTFRGVSQLRVTRALISLTDAWPVGNDRHLRRCGTSEPSSR
jgi:hypothetical protein